MEAPAQFAAVAAALAGVIERIAPTTYAHLWDPAFAGIDRVPAGIVLPPRDVDAMTNRAQLGSRDWRVKWPVLLYFDCTRLPSAQARAMETIEALTVAIDVDRTLDGAVEEARLINAGAIDIDASTARPLLEVEAIVDTRWQEAL